MKVDARNPEHRRRYTIFLDGVDISDCVQEADDIAHEAIVFVRRPTGKDVRRSDNKRLQAVCRGHVVIAPRIAAES